MDLLNTWMLWKRAIEKVTQTEKEMFRFVEGVETDRNSLEKEIRNLEQQSFDLYSMGQIAIKYQEIERLTSMLADAVLYFDIRIGNELVEDLDLEETEKDSGNPFSDLLYDDSDGEIESDEDDGSYDPQDEDENPLKPAETESGSNSNDPQIIDCYADWSLG